jgi:hypothetical protein
VKRPSFAIRSIGAFVAFTTIALTTAAHADDTVQKTVFKDATQRSKILGKHMLSLQWLQFEKNMYGSATVTDKGGVLYLKGEQRSSAKDGGYLKVDGRITEVSKNAFKFNGTIKTSVKSINNGEECLRQGDMNFLAKGARKYWRLQEMDSPCSEVTDYVDLYFH